MAAKRTVFFDLDKEAYRLLASHFKAFRHGQDSKVPWLKYDKDIKEVALHAKKAGGKTKFCCCLEGLCCREGLEELHLHGVLPSWHLL